MTMICVSTDWKDPKIKKFPQINFQASNYNDFSEEYLKFVGNLPENVKVVHFPVRYYPEQQNALIEHLMGIQTRIPIVVHPNKSIFGVLCWYDSSKLNLFFENFLYKRRKVFRTPMDIIHEFGTLCLDYCHLDEGLRNEHVLRCLLPHAGVVHLSSGYRHIPLTEKDLRFWMYLLRMYGCHMPEDVRVVLEYIDGEFEVEMRHYKELEKAVG